MIRVKRALVFTLSVAAVFAMTVLLYRWSACEVTKPADLFTFVFLYLLFAICSGGMLVFAAAIVAIPLALVFKLEFDLAQNLKYFVAVTAAIYLLGALLALRALFPSFAAAFAFFASRDWGLVLACVVMFGPWVYLLAAAWREGKK